MDCVKYNSGNRDDDYYGNGKCTASFLQHLIPLATEGTYTCCRHFEFPCKIHLSDSMEEAHDREEKDTTHTEIDGYAYRSKNGHASELFDHVGLREATSNNQCPDTKYPLHKFENALLKIHEYEDVFIFHHLSCPQRVIWTRCERIQYSNTHLRCLCVCNFQWMLQIGSTIRKRLQSIAFHLGCHCDCDAEFTLLLFHRYRYSSPLRYFPNTSHRVFAYGALRRYRCEWMENVETHSIIGTPNETEPSVIETKCIVPLALLLLLLGRRYFARSLWNSRANS